MLFRCCYHGPEILDDDISNPTLVLDGQKYCVAVESAERRTCSVDECDQYAYSWLTQDETTAWESGKRVIPHEEFGEVIVGGWTRSIAEYIDRNDTRDHGLD